MLEGINLESVYGTEVSTRHLEGHGICFQCRIFKNRDYISFLFPDKVVRVARGGSFILEEKSNHWQSFFINGTYFARVGTKVGNLGSREIEKIFHTLSRILSSHIEKDRILCPE